MSRPLADSTYSNVVGAVYMMFRGEPISILDIRQFCDLHGVWDELRFVTLVKIAENVLLKGKSK